MTEWNKFWSKNLKRETYVSMLYDSILRYKSGVN